MDGCTSTAREVIVRSLSSLGSKSLAHRRGRTVLTGLGVALGVALFFGVLVANRSVNRSFERLTVYQSVPTYSASVQRVDNSELSQEMVDRVRALPHVADSALPVDRLRLFVRI